MTTLMMIVGFALASYAIVANDAIQTLGTFLASNSRKPWWMLWAYAGSILTVVLVYGYVTQGDVSYGRLSKYPMPDPFTWIYVVPPFALLLLTRSGIPVSTTFLILTVFSPKNLESMIIKSLAGYGVAFAVAIVLYTLVARSVEKGFLETADQEPPTYWTVLQWLSTGFLWSQWLIQDLANIFVFLPRELHPGALFAALFGMLALQGWIFYSAGGEIQKIVTSKTNTQDIRSAAIVNFLFGLILMVFKEWSKLPMSTTWVFLGLLAGREIAMTLQLKQRPFDETLKLAGSDAAKAFLGLAVSVILALALPWIANQITPVDGADRVDEDAVAAPAP